MDIADVMVEDVTAIPAEGAHTREKGACDAPPRAGESLPAGWRMSFLGNVGQLVRGVTYDKDDATDSTSPGYLPILRATNITDSGVLLDEDLTFVPVNKISQSQLLRISDIVIAMSSGSKSVVGKSAQLEQDWPGSYGAFCAAFRPDTTVIDAFFVANVFKSTRYREHIVSVSRGTNINNLSKDHILGYRFFLPPLPEQRAIARALRGVRDAIQARRREAALERERKAALMQHLFTHGTRGEPTKQTEIGEMPESWQIVTLSTVCHGMPQNGAFIKDPNWGSGTPFVNVADVYRSVIINVGGVQHLQCDTSVLANYLLKRGDLLFVRSSLKREGVGQCCYVGELDGPAIYDCHLIRVSPNNVDADPLYLAYYFQTGPAKSDLIARSKTTTMTTLNQKSLSQTLVPRPSVVEQRAIVTVLGVYETRIAALEHETALLEELFRALLEELMTGRLRVPLDSTVE